MSQLLQAANDKLAEKNRQSRDKNKKDLEASLDRVIAGFSDEYKFGRFAKDGVVIEVPPRSEFKHVPYNDRVQIFAAGSRHTHVYGWGVTVEGLEWIFDTSESWGGNSLYLVHECPKCGVRGASTFYDLSDIAALVRNGPKFGHTCLELETRDVAWAIGRAARDLRLDPDTVIEETFSRHGEYLNRVRFGS